MIVVLTSDVLYSLASSGCTQYYTLIVCCKELDPNVITPETSRTSNKKDIENTPTSMDDRLQLLPVVAALVLGKLLLVLFCIYSLSLLLIRS